MSRAFMRKRNTFRPTDIGGCTLWLDGADPAGTGVAPVAGSTITTWADKSTSANNATAYGTVTVNTLVNGKLAMLTTASSGFFGYLTNSTTTATTFVVATYVNANAYNRLFAVSSGTLTEYNNPGVALFACAINGASMGPFYNSQNVTPVTSGPITQNQPFIMTTLFTGTQCRVNLNGISTTTSPVNISTSFSYTYYGIGTHANGFGSVGECWNGIIAEVIHYQAALSLQNYQQVEAYLSQKWGLRQQIPQSHPGTTGIVYSQQSIPKALSLPYQTAFVPTSISACKIWLDAADSATFTLNGSTVSTWIDKTGNGFNVSQATAGSQPTRGSNEVVFNGSTSLQYSGSVGIFGNSYTSYVIHTPTNNTVYLQGIISIKDSTTGFDFEIGQFYVWNSGGSIYQQFTVSVNSKTILGITSTTSLGLNYSINGQPFSAGGAGYSAVSSGSLLLIGNSQYSGVGFIGTINEYLLFTRTLTATEHNQITGYLAWKWGSQSSLPANHPYKNSVPFSATNPAGISRPVGLPVRSNISFPRLKFIASIDTPSATLSSLTSTGATVSWSEISGAISYTVTIYYNSSASVTTSNLQVAQSPYIVATSGSTFTFTATDTTYYAATVTAINASAQATSSISSAVLYTAPPGQVSANTPTNTGTTLNMAWSAASGSVTAYTVYVLAGGSLAPSGTLSLGNVTSTTFSPMVSGTAYSFYVIATGPGGSGTQSTTTAEVTYTAAPVAPTTVTLASLTGSGATVTWSGGSGASSYTCQIYSSTASNMSSPTTLTQSPSSSTSVSSGQVFSFSAEDSLYYGAIVTAVNASGSAASSISTGVQFVGTYSGLGPVTTLATGFGNLYNLAIDSAENIYLADYGGHKIWYIPSGGSPSIFAGSTFGYVDGAAGSAKFNGPSGVAISSDGSTVYVSDYGNSKIRKITGGTVTTLAGGTHGAWLDGASNVARFYYPSGIAIDRTGTVLFIGDKLTHRIRVVTIATGAVTTLAGGLNSTVGASGSFADGTGSNASFNSPLGVCVGLDNSVYVADSTNQRIRKVTYPEGVVTTIAGDGTNAFLNGTGTGARFSGPFGVAMDSYGILYVADKDSKRIRQITRTGVVTTFAGTGTNTNVDNANRLLATFVQPTGVVVNSTRTSLYVTQTATPAVRKITMA